MSRIYAHLTNQVSIGMPGYMARSIPTPWTGNAEHQENTEYGIALDSDGTEICYSSEGWSAGVSFGKTQVVSTTSSFAKLIPKNPLLGVSTAVFSISIIKDKTAIEGEDWVLSASHGMSMGAGYEGELAVAYPMKSLGKFLEEAKDTVLDVAGGTVTGMLSCDVERVADAVGRGLHAIAPSTFTASFFAKSGVRSPYLPMHAVCVGPCPCSQEYSHLQLLDHL